MSKVFERVLYRCDHVADDLQAGGCGDYARNLLIRNDGARIYAVCDVHYRAILATQTPGDPLGFRDASYMEEAGYQEFFPKHPPQWPGVVMNPMSSALVTVPIPPKPRAKPACECGARMIGARDFAAGHSTWCPVRGK